MIRFLTLKASLVVWIFLLNCSADPVENDAIRVKEQFLVLRFRAATNPELKGKTDQELFEISCINNRVRCDAVLEILSENDPEFYSTLTGEQSEQNKITVTD